MISKGLKSDTRWKTPTIFKFSVKTFEQSLFHPVNKIVYISQSTGTNHSKFIETKNTNGILELITLF